MFREVELQTNTGTYIYREEDLIGEGGFGRVYRGIETQEKIFVAIKRPHFHSSEALERFTEKDCRYLPKLQHDNIVKVFAVLTKVKNDKGVIGAPALIMEYIAGTSLHHGWEKQLKVLKAHERLLLFRKICQAIDYAHQQDIVHRDLKPGNILLTEESEPKIIDFGLAASLRPEEWIQLTRSKQLIGSLLYMAPEQQDARQADKKSDIYSLGLVLFFIFTGKHARELLFKGESTLAEVFTQELPSEVAHLCQLSCQLTKSKRPSSVEKLIGYVDFLLANQSIIKNNSSFFPWESHPVTRAWLSFFLLIGGSLGQVFSQNNYWSYFWLTGILALTGSKFYEKRVDSLPGKRFGLCFLSVLGGMFLSQVISSEKIWYIVASSIAFSTIFFWLYLFFLSWKENPSKI